jgi:GMP synthase-like glutamine amidotransferase
LIRDAVGQGVPVIGHCLGGQLLSKALGGVVGRNAVKEIGWSRVTPVASAQAERWLAASATAAELTVYQWHGETFSIPAGGVQLLRNAHCENQAFVCGPHLGMQCHIEMTPAMIERWCESWHDEVASLAALRPGVQAPAEMLAETAIRLPQMRKLADQLYSVWIEGLRRC